MSKHLEFEWFGYFLSISIVYQDGRWDRLQNIAACPGYERAASEV
jgi:hypothetical protein